eukprot:COSAG02_NODE_42005_length_388_cov_5.861592_1_plen_48_part_10
MKLVGTPAVSRTSLSSIDLNILPLFPLGLEIILSMERSTEWSPLLNSH